jgi:hypothetical protein
MLDDARGAQDAQVAGDVWLRELESFLEMANAQLPVRQQCDDPEPCLVSEGLEQTGEGSDIEGSRHKKILISGYGHDGKPCVSFTVSACIGSQGREVSAGVFTSAPLSG